MKPSEEAKRIASLLGVYDRELASGCVVFHEAAFFGPRGPVATVRARDSKFPESIRTNTEFACEPWSGDAETVARLAWSLDHKAGLLIHRKPISPKMLDLGLVLACDGEPRGWVEIGATDGKDAAAFRIQTDERVAIVMGCNASQPTWPVFPDVLDSVLERHPAVNRPCPLLWFDEEGCGPLDGIRLSISTHHNSHYDDRLQDRVHLRIEGTPWGGAFMSADDAEYIGDMLQRAAKRVRGDG